MTNLRIIAHVGFICALVVTAIGARALWAQGTGIITTVAGNGKPGNTGDGGLATNAELGFGALYIAPDSQGNLYILDEATYHIRKVNAAGIINTIAGAGTGALMDGAAAASVSQIPGNGLATDSAGDIYVCGGSVIWKIDAGGILHLIGGTLQGPGFSGDEGPAIDAQLGCSSLALDGAGNIYLTDDFTNHVRKIDTKGIITTIAGNGKQGYAGDGGPAINAELFLPQGVAADSAGNVYFADNAVYIRKVDTSGTIHTVAGNGQSISISDGVPATSTGMNPTYVAVDGAGNLFIADTSSNRVREVNTAGILKTVAGGITNFNLGDGGPATSASLQSPADVILDNAGNLYIDDQFHFRVRKVAGIGAPKQGGGGGSPSITANGVVNGASFQPGVVSGSWATIVGSNLSPATDTWAKAIVDGKLPDKLDGVSVTIGFAPAYIYYISPGQINLIVPPDLGPGPVQVTVKNSAGTSASMMVTASTFGPAFFLWPNNQAVATRQDFSLAAKAGTFAGVNTVAAKPGDVIILWGTGFGSTIPAVPPGTETPSSTTYSTSTKPTVTLNNISAHVYGAALAPGFAGLYQVAIQVPSSLTEGDWPLEATIGGVQSPSGAVLSVKQ